MFERYELASLFDRFPFLNETALTGHQMSMQMWKRETTENRHISTVVLVQDRKLVSNFPAHEALPNASARVDRVELRSILNTVKPHRLIFY